MNYSKQRKIIYDFVKGVKVHPTAETVYNELKKENKNLSIATVYRNLNKMSEEKEFKRLSFSRITG